MALNQVGDIHGLQDTVLDDNTAVHHVPVHAAGLAEDDCRQRVVEGASIVKPVEVDGAEVGAFTDFQRADQ